MVLASLCLLSIAQIHVRHLLLFSFFNPFVGPLFQRNVERRKFHCYWRKPISTRLVFDNKPHRFQALDALIQHRWRQVVAGLLHGSECEWAITQFPQNSQNPFLAQKFDDFSNWIS